MNQTSPPPLDEARYQRIEDFLTRLKAHINEGEHARSPRTLSAESTSKTLLAVAKLIQGDELAARCLYFAVRERPVPEDIVSAVKTAAEAVLETCGDD